MASAGQGAELVLESDMEESDDRGVVRRVYCSDATTQEGRNECRF